MGSEVSAGERVAPLSLEERVGQLFVVHLGREGSLLEALRAHRDNHYGGVFLSRSAMESPGQVREFNRRFRRHTRDVPPLIVCTDEEGGIVSTTAHLTSSAPSARALGSVDDEDVTRDVHLGIGEKLRALGFNTVFAPVVDVNVESVNPVIGTRSFGALPELVSKHGLAAVSGLRAGGVACCAKHFPGHGATSLDSHLTLPVVEADRETLGARELEPFRQLLESESPPELVMSAHVAYPAWDKSGRPATLSRPILHGLLREELHYKGVVVTDSMEMQGITEGYGPEAAAVDAIRAGADVLLYAMDPDMAITAYQAVLKAVKSNKISEERLDQSVERVFKLREQFLEKRWYTDDEAKEVLDLDHEQAFFGASESALVLEGNAGVLAQIPSAASPKVVVLPRELDAHRPLQVRVVREQLEPAGFTVVEVGARPTPEDVRRAESMAASASVIVVGTASRGVMAEENRRLVEALTRRDVIKIGVALLDPGDVDFMMTANCRIKTFGFSVAQLWALSQKLLG